MVFSESKQRMFALLENLADIFEAINVVTIKIHYHLLSAKHNSLKVPRFTV